MRTALRLLSDAGYELSGTQLRTRDTKKPLAFEMLVTTKDQERLALQFSDTLSALASPRPCASSTRCSSTAAASTYDFDMIQNRWDQSLSPGNEQAFYWGSAAASEDGTRNYMGVKSAAVDAMIAALLRAETHADFVSAVRALDRVLLSGFYVIPLFHAPEQWVARWSPIRHPDRTPLSGYLPEAWCANQAAERASLTPR